MDPSITAKNLASIQRIDPCAETILDKATHTALYRFNSVTRTWEKTDVDGALFLYQRVDVPYYSLIIANRQSPNDMIEPILPNVRVKMEGPYVFLCKPDGEIRGLWFYKEKDCQRLFTLIDTIISQLKVGQEKCTSLPLPPGSPAPVPVAPPVDDGNSILEMLRVAQTKTRPVSTTEDRSVPVSTQSPPGNNQGNQGIQGNATTLLGTGAGGIPSMLQKLLIGQSSGQTASQNPPSIADISGTTVDDIEKDLVASNRSRGLIGSLGGSTQQPSFMNSPSAASLHAFSTLSVHGSEDHDPQEIESVRSGGRVVDVDDSVIHAGESAVDAPLLDKSQFVSALSHLLSTNDEFVTQLHQAYVDSLNQRLRLE